jgi:hypothetical protein
VRGRRAVQRRVLLQLATDYERFDALITTHYRQPNITSHVVPVKQVVFQIKKYDIQGGDRQSQ